MSTIHSIQDDYWGGPSENAPTDTIRFDRSMEMLRNAIFDEARKIFIFPQYNDVCEIFVLNTLSFTSTDVPSKAPTQWKRARKFTLHQRGIESAYEAPT